MNTLHKSIFLSMCLCGASLHLYAGEDTNDCNDKEAEQGWVHLLSKYPHDQDVRYLYRLRSQMCQEIDQGTLSIQDAAERFEAAREAVKQKWIDDNRQLDEARDEPIAG